MADWGVVVHMPDLSKLDGKQWMQVLHDHSEEIAQPILDNIEARTPELTGALKEDETYQLGSGNLLVEWYVGDAYQLAEWHRPYAVYQEGPPMGLETYTNDAHQMFFRVTTDDLPLIADWAQRTVQDAAESMIEAANAGTSTWEM